MGLQRPTRRPILRPARRPARRPTRLHVRRPESRWSRLPARRRARHRTRRQVRRQTRVGFGPTHDAARAVGPDPRPAVELGSGLGAGLATELDAPVEALLEVEPGAVVHLRRAGLEVAMMEPVRTGLALGLLRQPEELQRRAPRPLDEGNAHPVIPHVEEADLGGGPCKLDSDPDRVGAVAQGGDVDHRHLAGVDRFGSRSQGHGRLSDGSGSAAGPRTPPGWFGIRRRATDASRMVRDPRGRRECTPMKR